jgi:PPP family 3-phenylpropionic acid transporter
LIPTVDATVIDHLRELGGDYGRLRLWGSVGFVFSSLASAVLVPLLSPASIPLLLLVAATGLAPAMARLPAGQRGHPSGFRAPWKLVDRRLATFLASGFLLQLSSGAWGGFFSVYTAALGLPEYVPGIAWGLAVTAEVAVLYFGTRVLARISPPDLIVMVLLMTAVRWVLTALARNELLVVLLQLGHGLAFAGFHLAAQMLLARFVPPESSTNGQALYGLVCFGLGGSLGLALAGALIDRVGPSAVFACEAGVAVLALAPALWLRRLVAPRLDER